MMHIHTSDLVLQVARYGKPGGPPPEVLSEKVKEFGVVFEPTAKTEIGGGSCVFKEEQSIVFPCFHN